MNAATGKATLFAEASRTVDLDGYTHYLDVGGPDGVPPLVCVHGLGGSHTNWMDVAADLAEAQHVYVPDLAGHGLTFPDHRSSDVDANQRLLDRFLREVSGTPAVLMGNSMGGLISILQAARNPATVAGLVLIDPAIPGPLQWPDPRVARNFLGYALPGFGTQLLARRRRHTSPTEQVREVLDLCCVDTGRVSADLFQRSVALAERRQSVPGVDSAFLDAARSLMAQLARRDRIFAAMRAVDVPVLLMQGDRDRLVPVEAARLVATRNPTWELRIADDIGHAPQIEAPQWTIATYREWAQGRGLLSGTG